MSTKSRTRALALPTHVYWGANVPMRAIRRFARQVGERFRPDKIILFGSHAYGTPHADSDVDILVIMPVRNELDQAFKIRCEVPTQFPMDLLVFKPQHVKWRLAERESFLTEIMTNGKILYEKNDPGVSDARKEACRPSIIPNGTPPRHRSGRTTRRVPATGVRTPGGLPFPVPR